MQALGCFWMQRRSCSYVSYFLVKVNPDVDHPPEYFGAVFASDLSDYIQKDWVSQTEINHH